MAERETELERLRSRGLGVWQVDLRRGSGWLEQAARSILLPQEATRRGSESDAVWSRRVVTRTALRVALGRWLDRDPRSLRFVTASNGKPRLVESANGALAPHFNVSHSNDFGVIAISAAAAVGVDVEAARNRPHLERLVETRLAPEEADAIMRLEGDQRRRAFYRCWTRKEAYLKALGLGLAADLSQFAVSVGASPTLIRRLDDDTTDFTLTDLDLGAGFAGAIALADPAVDLSNPLRPSALTGML